jgi:hypothetical protein
MNALKRKYLVAVAVGLMVTACGGNKEADQKALQAEQEHVQNGIAVADTDDPNRWAPPPEAIEQAKQDAAAPAIHVGDLSELKNDPSLSYMEVLPPQPEPPKLAQGDEADQYGLPEWEAMARGDLHVKRIRY